LAVIALSLLIALVAFTLIILLLMIAKNGPYEGLQLDDPERLSNILLDASPMMVEVWDDSLNIIGCNQTLLDTFGMASKDEYFPRYYEFSPEMQPCGIPSRVMTEKFNETVFREGFCRMEWMYILPDGSELPTEIYGVRVNYRGRFLLVEYMQDMREIKAAEANEREAIERAFRTEIAEESNRVKSEFLARMSHEIRTPISAVAGISEIQLQKPYLTIEMEKAFSQINNSAQLLTSIASDILDLSKIEAGKMEFICKEYNLARLIGDVSYTHLTFVGDKEIKFALNVDENLPAKLLGDTVRIRQILNNVLSNAFKYTDAGSVEMTVEMSGQGEGDKQFALKFTVSDTGLGMTPKQLDNLHAEYVRFHERERRYVGGAGLGMPIAYNLVRMMNGKIEIESEEGKGTTVKIFIPQEILGDEVLGADEVRSLQKFEGYAETVDFTPEPMSYGRVLVVDDLDVNLYVAKGLLSQYGLKVDTCGGGLAALEKIKQGNVYDIVFMDHTMPRMSGIEAMNLMRKAGYASPIVVLTANAVVGMAEGYIKSGFNDFLSKPIQTKHLDAILTKYIRNKRRTPVDEAEDYKKRVGIMAKLRHEFYRSQNDAGVNLKLALDEGKMETARLLAHSLKGLAALINEHTLSRYAKQIEHTLNELEIPSIEDVSDLENELQRVLNDIGETEMSLYSKDARREIAAILDELAEIIDDYSTDSLSIIEKIRTVPEAAVLVRQIETHDFRDAAKTLLVLRELIGT